MPLLQRWRTWNGLPGINAIIDALNNLSGSHLVSSSITNSTLADMTAATIKGRASGAGTGAPTDLTANQVSTILDTATDPFVRTSAAAAVGERGRVRAATTANITISTALNNGDTLDGVTLATGDLVLVKNQSSAAENGVYVVGTSPARSGQYDAYDEHPGVILTVMEGTTNADTIWLCTSNKGGTIGVTALVFAAVQTTGSITSSVSISTADGRLTTESGVPVSSSDRASQSTIYFTPYNGTQISLYNGSAWALVTFAELSLALSGLTSGKNYDVFVDYNGGTPQLVLSAAWTNDTTRADALALQNGVYVKSGTPAYRFAGTIRTTGTTTTEDSAAKRFVWNMNHRRPRTLLAQDSSGSPGYHSYTTASYRQFAGSATFQVEVVTGAIGSLDALEVAVLAGVYAGANNEVPRVGVGVNSTSTNSAQQQTASGTLVATKVPLHAKYSGVPALGYSYFAMLEYGSANATAWYEYYDTDGQRSGISGLWVA